MMPTQKYENEKGERIPGVTTVEREWGGEKLGRLMGWAWKKGQAGQGLWEKPEAEIGTLVHLMIDDDIKGRKTDLSKYPMEHVVLAQKAFENYGKWKKQHDFKPVETELALVSEKHQYGGTIDCIAEIDSLLSICDWKSGADIYESHLIQIVAYAKLWEENFPDHPLKGGYHILRTGKEIAMFSHNWYGEFPGAWEAFLCLRQLYDLGKQIKKLK